MTGLEENWKKNAVNAQVIDIGYQLVAASPPFRLVDGCKVDAKRNINLIRNRVSSNAWLDCVAGPACIQMVPTNRDSLSFTATTKWENDVHVIDGVVNLGCFHTQEEMS